MVNKVFDTQLMAERVESLKAGMLAGVCLTFAFLITNVLNSLILVKYFNLLNILQMDTLNLQWLARYGIAAFCGLLFGVTYRYIIRSDNNPQLKAGGVLAFGLVRGLTQLDVGFSCSSDILPFIVMGIESILGFGLAGLALDIALQFGWIKTFK